MLAKTPYYTPPPSIWTEERVEQLKTLWATGMTALLIAREIGAWPDLDDDGRSAVLGRAHRMELPSRKSGHRVKPDEEKLAEWARNRNAAKRARRAANPKVKREKVTRLVNRASRFDLVEVDEIEQAAEVPIAANSRPCQLQELTDDTCRWPVGDVGEPGFHFCGAVPKDGKPYCVHHHAIAYQKPNYGPRKPYVEWRVR